MQASFSKRIAQASIDEQTSCSTNPWTPAKFDHHCKMAITKPRGEAQHLEDFTAHTLSSQQISVGNPLGMRAVLALHGTFLLVPHAGGNCKLVCHMC